MINHIRTLIINPVSPQKDDLLPYAEYMPVEYKHVPDSVIVKQLRTSLFGESPDVFFLNCRAQLVMRLLHASPWADHITEKDPRITYRIDSPGFFAGEELVLLPSPPQAAAWLYGQPQVDEQLGRCEFSWQIAQNSPTEFEVLHNSVSQTITASGRLPLPGQPLALVLPPTYTMGQTYYVRVVTRPTASLLDLLQPIFADSSSKLLNELFGQFDDSELLFWRTAWQHEPTFLNRCASLLFGLARLTELQAGIYGF